MSVAKIIEISATSSESFEDAIQKGIKKTEETLHNVKGAWIAEQKVDIEGGKIVAYRVIMRISFVLD